MTVLNDEELWVAEFAGVSALPGNRQPSLDQEYQILHAKEERELQARRRAHIKAAHDRVNVVESQLEEFRKVRLEIEGKLANTKMDLIGPDATKAFGFLRDMTKVLKSPENMTQLYRAQEEVIGIEAELRASTMERTFPVYSDEVGEDGRYSVESLERREVALFTDRDIENEFYTRLVRCLLYPEELVPDEVSAVQRMIDESNALYIQKLETIAKVKDNPAERFGPAIQAVISASATMATTGVGLGGGTTQTKEVATAAITISEAIINTGIGLGVQISRSDVCGGVSSVLDGLSGGVEAALKLALPMLGVDPSEAGNIAKGVSVGMKGASRIPTLVDALANPGPDDAEVRAGKFIGSLGDLWGDAFDALSIGQDDATTETLSIFKIAVTTTYSTTAVAMKGQLASKLEQGDWAGVRGIVAGMSAEVIQGGLKGLALHQAKEAKAKLDDPSSDEHKAVEEAVRKQMKIDGLDPNNADQWKEALASGLSGAKGAIDSGLSSVADAIASGNAEVVGSLIELDSASMEQGLLEQQQEWEEQSQQGLEDEKAKAAETYEEEVENEKKAFEEELDLLSKGDLTDEDEEVLGRMIAKMKRDRAILDTLFAVGSAGSAVASQFFGPMAAAGTLVTVVKEGTLAVERTIHLRKWVDSRTGASNAVSPYLASIQNFCKNLGVQLAHHTIKAALNALKAAGQILQAAGPVAGIGKAVDAAASVALSVEELVYTSYKEDVLKEGWKETKYALANPRDRKTNQIARKINPTFAKYTIAYGMFIAKDPVALEAGRKVKLTRTVLQSKDAGVDKIVEFLETLYNEDVQIYKHYEDGSNWPRKTSKPKVAIRSWMNVHFIAVSEGGLIDTHPEALNQAFAKAEASLSRVHKEERTARDMEKLLTKIRPQIDAKEAPVEEVPDLAELEPVTKAYDQCMADLMKLETYLEGFQAKRINSETQQNEVHPQMVELVEEFLAVVSGERVSITSLQSSASNIETTIRLFNLAEMERRAGL